MSKPKEIKENYMVGLGSLEIKAKFPKLTIAPGEEIKVDISTDSNLHFFKKITKITQTFYRNIKWVGYMKNTLLDKHIFEEHIMQYNKSQYNLLDILTFPIKPIISSAKLAIDFGKIGYGLITKPIDLAGFAEDLINFDNEDYNIYSNDNGAGFNPVSAVFGGIGGVIFASLGMGCGLYEGFKEQKNLVKDWLYKTYNITSMVNKYKNKIDENKLLLLIENIKKFVYFKDNKVVGFIKFAQNITPNVNGYYFNCEYNIKIDVDIEGIILNRNKYLKTQFDLYDSEEYITHMKNLLKN